MTAALRQLDYLGLADKQVWTVDDLDSLPEDLLYELLDGRLVLSSPTVFHQWVGVRLVVALEANEPDGFYVVPDFSVAVSHRNQPRPDVVVVRDDGPRRVPGLVENVLLAVEILSPSSIDDDCGFKVKKYADAGIPRYWVIDPLSERMTFIEHILGSDGQYRSGPPRTGSIDLDWPWPVTVDLSQFERRRDRHR
jgi:Uma2 family endonuclease